MKNLFLGILLAVAGSAAQADVTGTYLKKGGELDVKNVSQGVQFSINSSAGTHTCSLGEDETLIARPVDGNRAAWTSSNPADQCVVLLNFSNGAVQVTTKGCEGYCGVSAAGSMAGRYLRR